jgi:hypothetical protein
MVTELVEQIVHYLALELSHAMEGRVLIETDRRSLFGRDVVELRVFLSYSPGRTAPDHWIERYRQRLATVFELAGMELAADEWFTPSQRFPSCGCWIMQHSSPMKRRLKAV